MSLTTIPCPCQEKLVALESCTEHRRICLIWLVQKLELSIYMPVELWGYKAALNQEQQTIDSSKASLLKRMKEQYMGL